jgi:hypothetical protein
VIRRTASPVRGPTGFGDQRTAALILTQHRLTFPTNRVRLSPNRAGAFECHGAAILKEPKGKLQIEERAVPAPGPGDILIRVRACGVCHGDLMVRNGEFPFVRFPIVPGHEVAGVVESVGAGVDHPRPGTRVGVPWLFSACGHCKQCILG